MTLTKDTTVSTSRDSPIYVLDHDNLTALKGDNSGRYCGN
jgi:hypothetical protein